MKTIITFWILLIITINVCWSQIVPINDYSVNNFGQVELSIEAKADKYYMLSAWHEPNLTYESIVSQTMGVDGTLIISEPAGAYPLQNYTITEHSIASPDDADGDGIDDISEFNSMPTNAPLNFAEAINFTDGVTSIDNAETFASLAVVEDVPWAPFLNGQQFVKFGILNSDTDQPELYFINSNTHFIHAEFFYAIGATVQGDDGSGEIVFNPNEILSNGAIGSYSFNFSFGEAMSFEATQRTYELLVASMPFLNNNMQHFIGSGGESIHNIQYKNDFVGSRIDVVLESDVFADIDFIPFNQAEGFGFFKKMELDENPGSRDIVLYDALPNSLPRVGGIITSVVQTPLSHVNLRAIQDNVPNAYIKDPLAIDSIANLIGNYVYYKVEDDSYHIREATLDEVNEWYEKLRPTEPQIPIRDLSFTEILPLESIEFEMSTAFGAKCSNVATMRRFGFPEETIPDGFGIPFYFYDEFMKFNNFYQEVEDMLTDPDFVIDLETRIDRLKDLRNDIRDAPMPQWMLDQLQAMHEAFPDGTSVRCRSSTNNEDLPGFSGAGLYTSKTQHPEEGHISKSIKQVYASMWNFRAFDERDFYRVDHIVAAMGILCHPNFEDEKSNGVGVSIDPIYNTENTFYLNTQIGESLITNPDENSIPEELLLYEDIDKGYVTLRESNLVNSGELVMDTSHLNQMRNYLKVIHDEFAILYDVVGAEGFGMDIEYKVTAEDVLIIKQARPWVSFWADIHANFDLGVSEIIHPQSSSSLGSSELVSAKIANQGLNDMSDFEISLFVEGQFVETLTIADTIVPFTAVDFQFTVPQDFSTIGDYTITAVVNHDLDGYKNNDTLNFELSKLHILEAGISIKEAIAKCNGEVDVKTEITNYGENTFSVTEIEVVANGEVVDTFIYNSNIPYQAEVTVPINVSENLQPTDNQITLNLIKVNDEEDAVPSNNSATVSTDLTSDFDEITLVINADYYPEEISWEIVDVLNDVSLEAGGVMHQNQEFTQDFCVDYNSCFAINIYDSYGDGIFSPGYFSITNSDGEIVVYSDGNFEFETQELFCPNGVGCVFTADFEVTKASDEFASDAVITINPTSGLSPYLFSIDGGQTFFGSNTFSDLPIGQYMIVVKDASGICSYEETITVDFEILDQLITIGKSSIQIFPNPTTDNITIEIAGSHQLSNSINIDIYDYLGKIIHSDVMALEDNISTSVISLLGYAPGSYFVKLYNNNFEEYLKIVKVDRP